MLQLIVQDDEALALAHASHEGSLPLNVSQVDQDMALAAKLQEEENKQAQQASQQQNRKERCVFQVDDTIFLLFLVHDSCCY